MASSNRTRIVAVVESTLGTMPGTPRMRTMRITGESLTYTPTFIASDELRSDRMTIDPIESITAAGGGINFELSYPDDKSPLSEIYKSAFYNTWVNTPVSDNDGSAASIITGVTTAGTVATVTGTGTYAVGHLVRFTGFGVTLNNGIFRCTTSSATVPAFVASGITDEATPAAAARMKVVGFQGIASDITVVAGGLHSLGTLNFTTLGLAVGQWLKIGGTAVGDQFTGTPANNGWARITAITATDITLDNKPVGWTADTGNLKTIKVWFGDRIINGTTQSSLTIEKGHLGQTAPTYQLYNGMVVDTLTHPLASKAKVTGAVTFKGMGGSQSQAAADASVDAATTGSVMACNANVGRLAENGAALTSPNWASSFEFSLNNNALQIEAVDSTSPVSIVGNECTVTGKVNTYFGDNTLLTKFYAGTATSFNSRVTKNSQAVIFTLPRVTYMGGGNPQATGKNVEVMLQLDFAASIDVTYTNAQICMDRVEYYE